MIKKLILILSLTLSVSSNNALFAQTSTLTLSPTDSSNTLFLSINNGELSNQYSDGALLVTSAAENTLSGTTFSLSQGQSFYVYIVCADGSQPQWTISNADVLKETRSDYNGAYGYLFTGVQNGSTDLTFTYSDSAGNSQKKQITIQVVNCLSLTSNVLTNAYLGTKDSGKTFTLSKSGTALCFSPLTIDLCNHTSYKQSTYTFSVQGNPQILTQQPSSVGQAFNFIPTALGRATLIFTSSDGSQTYSYTINVVE